MSEPKMTMTGLFEVPDDHREMIPGRDYMALIRYEYDNPDGTTRKEFKWEWYRHTRGQHFTITGIV